jgi:hypothetical protein
MGVVDEVVDEERGMRVARKRLREIGAEALAQFKREFRAVRDLSHPNLVTLHELLCQDEEWFFTMELIEGSDLLPWLRAASRRGADDDAPPSTQRGASCDDRRLRSALAQLASGLGALHAAGIVHRDVKPSNVRVDAEGRVVLLDFGLAIDRDASVSTDVSIAGTPAYMAPEQAVGRAIGPEADFYALGVIAYEALTGRVPFDGAPLDILLRKQREAPPPPSSLAPGVPPDIDRLCMSLLAFDPARRPDLPAILAAVGARPASTAPSHSGAQASPFVGRTLELDALGAAFEDRGRGRLVVLAGESGIGKSCLVRRFLTLLEATEQGLVVLPGRCHEHEAVPYKALDGVVDALARFLKEAKDAGSLLPTRPGPLAQIFPVLRRVEAIAAAPLTRDARALDPIELRARAFVALRELLVRLSDARPVVVTIDDLQWADAESLALLREVVRRPDAPGLLLLATMRSAADPSEAERRVHDTLAQLGAEVLPLEPLAPEHARELAARLMLRVTPDLQGDPEAIAAEAEGHPLYIDALVRHTMIATGQSLAPPRLEDALGQQVRMLDPAARRVMQLVAVAGAPLAQSALASAADVPREEFARVVSFLRVGHLASITGVRGSDTIECYHDKVRIAVVTGLAADELRADHRRLAVALEASGTASSESLAKHWFAAAEPVRGSDHAERAGDEAAKALAFDHAASFYARALDAAGDDPRRRLELGEKLGSALADAGRTVPSAAAFDAAASLATPVHALELRRRSVEQLLRGGRFDVGFDALGQLLASVGARLPRTPIAAVFSIVAWRLYLRLRGLSFRPREVREITQMELTKVDVCWSMAMTLSFTDNVRGAAFSGRNVALALRCGHPGRVARALALDVGYVASTGSRGWARAEALRERARALAEQAGDDYALAWVHASAGLSRWLRGEYDAAYEHLVRAEARFRDSCTGVAWELATVRTFILNALCYRGDLVQLVAMHPGYLRDALDRGDLYTAGSLRTALPGLYWLVLDRVAELRRQIGEVEGSLSSRGFHVLHSRVLNMHVFADLYEGRPAEALARIEAARGALRRSLLLRVEYVRTSMTYLRGCARVTLAVSGGGEAHLAAAARDAAIVSSAIPGKPLGRILEASIAAARGHHEVADRSMREAIELLGASKVDLFAAAARRARGVLAGGAEGARLVEGADAWMARRGVVAPERFARCLVPQIAQR